MTKDGQINSEGQTASPPGTEAGVPTDGAKGFAGVRLTAPGLLEQEEGVGPHPLLLVRLDQLGRRAAVDDGGEGAGGGCRAHCSSPTHLTEEN